MAPSQKNLAFRATMWEAQRRARQLPTSFTAAQCDKALELLAENDYQRLLHKRAPTIRGKLTWARLSLGVATALGRVLVEGSDTEAVAERAELLAARLAARDATPHARVPNDTRHLIGQVRATAATMAMLREVRDGARRASEEDAGTAIALRQRWLRLRSTFGGGDEARLRRLVEAAAGKVLASDANGVVKALFLRAAQRWTPPPHEQRAGTAVARDDEL